MASPTAVPMIPDSASGVSKTRSSPKSFCSPSVIRKTPPSLPTSSPITRTFGSRSMAARSPLFNAFAIVIVLISGPFDARTRKRFFGLEGGVVGQEGIPLGVQHRRRLGVHLGEHPLWPRLRHVRAVLPEPGGQGVGLGGHLVEE